MEMVRFTVAPENEAAFTAGREPMIRAMRKAFTGLEQATLAKMDDGSYVDCVIWTTREEALKAANEMMTVPEAASWAQKIEKVNIMEHAKVKHEATIAP